ncbi:hypothetical protein HDV04_006004 [Boothiomyces sp. JEL0838]|nr:hypothetical protein HDV04_006004 [Boothiomyces sp. JEL0838]
MLHNLNELDIIASYLPLTDYHNLRFSCKANLPFKPNLSISAYKETCKLFSSDISGYIHLQRQDLYPDSFLFLVEMNHTMAILKAVKYMDTTVLVETLDRYCEKTVFNEVVILFIAKYLDPRIKYNLTSLFLASLKNDSLALTRYLLSNGVDPTLPNNKPLLTAVKYKSAKTLSLLLQLPVDPTVNENYCLRKAIDNQDLISLGLLLDDQRVDPAFSGYYAIHQISSIGNLETLRMYLNNSRVNIDDCGFLGLYTACEYGNARIVEYLLQLGIDPSQDNNYCISIASTNGFSNVVELLLKCKKVNPAVDKSFPFRMAATNGHLKVLEILSKTNADPTAMNNAAIRMASSNGHYHVVKYLLKIPKINPAAVHNYALRKACLNGHKNIVQLLLTDERVQPSSHRYQAIKNCFENRHDQIVKILLTDYRVDLHFENNYALYKATECGFIDIYKLYNPNRQSNSTCLKLASSNGHSELVSLILEGDVDPTLNDYECIRSALVNGHYQTAKLLKQDHRVDTCYASTLH